MRQTCPHSVLMCLLWIWEQTAIISLYRINWLVFITETECVYSAVRTGSLNIVQVICFVWIWEQKAIISLYRINWLVFIIETEYVYSAVRTGSLNKGHVTFLQRVKSIIIHNVYPGFEFRNLRVECVMDRVVVHFTYHWLKLVFPLLVNRPYYNHVLWNPYLH